MADDGADAARLRATLNQTLAGEPAKKGGVLAVRNRFHNIDYANHHHPKGAASGAHHLRTTRLRSSRA
jgi:hypothetical protein